MIRIDARQVQADLPAYLEQVARGESILLTCEDRPVAELRPVSEAATPPRALGLGVGLGTIQPSFFEPLPDDLVSAFGGES